MQTETLELFAFATAAPAEPPADKTTLPVADVEEPVKPASKKPAKTVGKPQNLTDLHFHHRAIPDWANDVLEAITVEAQGTHFHAVLHSGQLPPEKYGDINEILVNLGGKWHGNKKAHLFPYDPSEALLAVQKTGKFPAKNPLDFFPTPAAAIQQILDESPCQWMLSIYENSSDEILALCKGRLLEPSAGGGNIIHHLLQRYPGLRGKIDAVEANPINVQTLQQLKKNGDIGEIYETDFLSWEPPVFDDPETCYRMCVMNPPFSYLGNKHAYIDHILHAWDILRNNPAKLPAILIAITPTGWIENTETTKTETFRNIVAVHGSVQDLPPKTFKESGTNINTCVVYLEFDPKTKEEDVEHERADIFLMEVQNDQEGLEEFEAVGKTLKENPKEGEKEALQFLKRWASRSLKSSRDLFPTTPGMLEAIKTAALTDYEDRLRYQH